MTVRRYRLSPLAEADLEAIWLYTLETWSQAQADRYYHQFVATFDALAKGICQGSLADIRPGYFKRRCGAHVLYYRMERETLDIIRILHARQDIDRHLPKG